MHELKLQPVGIGEEQRVVARAVAVVRILGRRIEDVSANADQQPVQAVDVLATCGMPGKMMKTGAVTIVNAIRARRF